MKNFTKIIRIVLIVSVPLTISGCGVKGDPQVPLAPARAQ